MRILIDGQTLETDDFYRGIGTYMRNVLPRLLKFSLSNQYYLVLSDEKYLGRLDDWTRNRLQVILLPEVKPSTDYTKERQYTRTLQRLIDEKHIDAIWNPNPLMNNVLFYDQSLTCKTFVTIHDLIPLIMPVKGWPESITNEYYRRLDMIRSDSNICLLFDSESSRRDWITNLNDQKSSMIVHTLAADARRYYFERKKTGQTKHIILFTGGFDYRKNIDGAIEAFALARLRNEEDSEFQKYKLVIVGSCTELQKKQYEHMVSEKGLDKLIEFTGFVTDEQLAKLYHDADIFFFPSKYEGFGLPLLEAMLSGDYIVSADNSSLPEVCGSYATFFSVDDTEQMAAALYEGYCRYTNETEADIKERQEYALKFSWDRTAIDTLEFMEKMLESPFQDSQKPSLAILTPWPNQKTGIGNYEYMLSPYLAKYFNITVFTNANEVDRKLQNGIEICDLQAYQIRKKNFDYRLFQIGNNDKYHKEIFDIFFRDGGIAEIHDYVLSTFFYLGYFMRGEKRTYRKLLKLSYGKKIGKKVYHETAETQCPPDIYKFPMSEAVVNLSQKAIFHNQWSANQLQSEKTIVLPHPSFPFKTEEMGETTWRIMDKVKEWRKQGYLILGCMGWINENKHPEISIQTVKNLKNDGVRVKLVFWGESNMEMLQENIEEQGLRDDVIISGYLERKQYYRAFLYTDVVINLRHPSLGESSGPLCEAFQLGKAVIISDINQYREYPDDVCWKLPVDEKEADVLTAYVRYLYEHSEVRLTLGNNAKVYADYVLSPERIARKYYDFITQDR